MFSAATEKDCEAVGDIATRTFIETYGELYRPENLAQHVIKTCSAEYFRAALKAGDNIILLHDAGKLIGYGKVGQMRLPYKDAPKGSQEIHRVYVEKAQQGRGFGKKLMFELMALPRITTAPASYLSVYEKNLIAQGLYAHYGFAPVGRYMYQVGDQYDPEIIMGRVR